METHAIDRWCQVATAACGRSYARGGVVMRWQHFGDDGASKEMRTKKNSAG